MLYAILIEIIMNESHIIKITKNITKCSKCGTKTRIYAKVEPHIGLYCKNCLKWIAWVPKDFIRIPLDKIETLEAIIARTNPTRNSS